MGVTTIDGYLAPLGPDKRKELARLRKQIRAAAPEAEECISYGQPAFRQGGIVCGFGATKRHCGFYMFDDKSLRAFARDLEGYDVGKGTIRFQPDAPLPAGLVKRIVKARVATVTAEKRR